MVQLQHRQAQIATLVMEPPNSYLHYELRSIVLYNAYHTPLTPIITFYNILSNTTKLPREQVHLKKLYNVPITPYAKCSINSILLLLGLMRKM